VCGWGQQFWHYPKRKHAGYSEVIRINDAVGLLPYLFDKNLTWKEGGKSLYRGIEHPWLEGDDSAQFVYS
jgi:hypothetical protein